MTDTKPRGPKPTYPLRDMIVGDMLTMPAPTPADVKRISRNTSQYGLRNGRYYMCRTDTKTRLLTITRVR